MVRQNKGKSNDIRAVEGQRMILQTTNKENEAVKVEEAGQCSSSPDSSFSNK